MKRSSASKSGNPMLPLHISDHPVSLREENNSPPASAFLSPDGRRLSAVPEEDVTEHFSFSTTLRRHRRRTSDGELEVSDFVMSPGMGPKEKMQALAARFTNWWANYIGSSSQSPPPTNGTKEDSASPSETFSSISIEVGTLLEPSRTTTNIESGNFITP